VDSHKLILAVVLDQGLAKKTQEKGHCMQTGQIHRKPNPKLARDSSRIRKEKGNGKERTKDWNRTGTE
jgi:hypothetical protein